MSALFAANAKAASGSLRTRVTRALFIGLLILPLAHCNPDPNGAFREIAKQAPAGCCREFRVGYDMTITDFGVDPSVRAAYASFAQAMGDYVAASTRMLDEVTGACRGLALDFGATDTDATVRGRTGEEASFAWCNLAVRKLQTAFSDTLQVAGHISVKFAPPDCFVDSAFESRCESTCAADPNCQEKGVEERCQKSQEAGLCSGKCTGQCLGSVLVPGSCEGKCDAECEGTCLGECHGMCEGAMQPGGRCRGACLGVCDGVCKGRCTGECHYAKTASGRCDTQCMGGCSVPLKGLKCAADLGPPTCPGNPDCDANCKAIGQVRASCTPPSIIVGMSEDIFNDPVVEGYIRSLELNMPKLYNATEGRGVALEADARAAVEAGGRIVADKVKVDRGKLGIKGTACAIVMQAAADQAMQNIHTAMDAAKTVIATIPAR
jgi:hypothetical protein